MVKKLLILNLCVAGLRVFGADEIQLTLLPAYTTFIRGEVVVVQLELMNAGRELIKVGTPDANSRFFIEVYHNNRYNQLKSITQAPFAKAFKLKPGAKHISKIQLDKWFNLLKEGRYYAHLVLLCNGVRHESTRKVFDVVPGVPIAEGVQMFVEEQQLKRTFRVVSWSRSQAESLFLRIEDEPGGTVWDTIDLGAQLKGSQPKFDISEAGEVTVVHRTSQDALHRIVVWSLPGSVEIAERNVLLDPEVSASQRVRSLYGEMVEEGPVDPDEKKWWQFWK
jgi:hypothetical protein